METKTVIPAWFDKSFVETLLQEKDTQKQINVTSFSVNPAVTAGNNYCCLVLRVNIDYRNDNGQQEHVSLIIKTPLPDGPAKELIEQLGFTVKECLIYKELIPLMNNILKKNVAPKNFTCQIPDTLILEDLKQRGYVMCDRLKQLDFDHCNAFMKHISKFHALSLYIYKQNPELIEKAGTECYYKINPRPSSKIYFNDGFYSFAKTLEEWKCFEKCSDFINNNLDALWDRTVNACNAKKNIRVLNHGDAWTNNMLFKHNNAGDIIDVQLIDFQLCRFASPALDIITFLVTSAQEDVKQYRLPELYMTYLRSFNSTLENNGCEERLSLEMLQEELKFVESLHFCLLPTYLPMVLCERDNMMDLQQSLEIRKTSEEEGKRRMWNLLNGENYKKVAKYSIKTLEEQGFFDSYK